MKFRSKTLIFIVLALAFLISGWASNSFAQEYITRDGAYASFTFKYIYEVPYLEKYDPDKLDLMVIRGLLMRLPGGIPVRIILEDPYGDGFCNVVRLDNPYRKPIWVLKRDLALKEEKVLSTP